MKELMKEECSKKLLEPYLGYLFKMHFEAKEEIRRALTAANQWVDKGTEAKLMNTFVKNKARAFFFDKPVTILERYTTLEVVFKDEQQNLLIGRWKKVNRKKLSATNSTMRSNSITFQTSLYPENITYVDFGYMVDVTGTEIENIYVICRQGNAPVWWFNIDVEDVQGLLTPTVAPIAPTPPPVMLVTVRNK